MVPIINEDDDRHDSITARPSPTPHETNSIRADVGAIVFAEMAPPLLGRGKSPVAKIRNGSRLRDVRPSSVARKRTRAAEAPTRATPLPFQQRAIANRDYSAIKRGHRDERHQIVISPSITTNEIARTRLRHVRMPLLFGSVSNNEIVSFPNRYSRFYRPVIAFANQ